jgi:hypothetical protein
VTKVIGAMNFIKISFAADCIIGMLFLLIVYTTELNQDQLLDLSNGKVWLVNIISSIFNVGGEFFIIKAI